MASNPFTILSPVKNGTLRTAKALVTAGFIAEENYAEIDEMARRYAIAITPEMTRLIKAVQEQDNIITHDPIALQFVPDLREMTILPQEMSDPIGDYPHSPMKALVHRHANRVLLKPTNVCAVYCRFCFRRDMVGPEGDSIMQQDVDEALDYIEAHPEISEVILTGGDPLMLSVKRMAPMMQRLHAIPHIRWIRLHTRIPVVAPKKMTAELLGAMCGEKPLVMAIHANHVREFTPAAVNALRLLSDKGVMLLGQSVLLKGINDTVDALADLVETMMQNRIKPYYLHHPDLTRGTSHFRFPFEHGLALMDALRERVSGVCMPQYTLDIPGGHTKIAINRDTVRAVEGRDGHYVLRDPSGQLHSYADPL